MDIKGECTVQQHALLRADQSACKDGLRAHLAQASPLAGRIRVLHHELGTAAACAWSMTQVSAPGRA